MKISWNWLNKEYFAGKLPSGLDAVRPILKNFTMTSFEVESIEEKDGGDLLIDVKVTPNRSHDCLCYNGLAGEFALSNNLELKWLKPWESDLTHFGESKVRELFVNILEPKLCKRYVGRVIENIKVGPSPEWLVERLSSIGQRSINNVVDSANYIMWVTGQPLHAFDADKISGNTINVRRANVEEKITTLDNKEVKLSEAVLVIADDKDPLAIAGIKGGKKAEVDEGTRNIILESANFQSTNIRKTSRAIGIKTDASYRFEHEISPELAGAAIEMLADLVLAVAKTKDTKIGCLVDDYQKIPKPYKLGVSLSDTNSVLGLKLTEDEFVEILNKLRRYSRFDWEVVNPLDQIIEMAPKYIGVPYKYSTSITYDAPRLFDCSAFTAFLYSEVGIAIPRISIDQYFFGDHVEEENIKPGDLIFAVDNNAKVYFESVEFLPGSKVEKGISHVGLYLGDGKVIHANGRTGAVIVEPYLESESFKNLCGFRRIVRENRDKRFVVTIPRERLDLVSQYGFYKGGNKEDLIEEVGRVYGFYNIKSVLPNTEELRADVNKGYYVEELIRSILREAGLSEVYGYSFVASGDEKKHVKLANPLADDKAHLRHNLFEGLVERCDFNIRNKDLLNTESIKLFELGKVFSHSHEELHLALAVEKPKMLETVNKDLFDKLGVIGVKPVARGDRYLEFKVDDIISQLSDKDSYEDLPSYASEGVAYHKYSIYPHASRDIAVFVPNSMKADDVLAVIISEATDLLVKTKLFDVFTKTFEDGTSKTSYAFRLVFQAKDRTLTGEETGVIMDKISNALNSKKEWKVR